MISLCFIKRRLMLPSFIRGSSKVKSLCEFCRNFYAETVVVEVVVFHHLHHHQFIIIKYPVCPAQLCVSLGLLFNNTTYGLKLNVCINPPSFCSLIKPLSLTIKNGLLFLLAEHKSMRQCCCFCARLTKVRRKRKLR